MKAVRDKEGNALRNSHVVGFFRRICKLLFFGVKPVFVFDGGAPALKRQTISSRKRRREGRREDAVRTAGKLLALQMQRRAEEEEAKRKEASARPAQREEEELPDELVYVDELQMTQKERQQGRKFKKKDQYHLPELDVAMAEMGGPNDPRVMSLEELEQYAQQFNSGEDINVYDFSKIDFNSPFFLSLPASDRYNILNAARLRSRLRMGLSKDQLDDMFPDRMAFSRFQIERVKERNELTQRLMHVNGMVEDMFGVDGTGRVAGEKGREYVLVKNAGVEGGWALGVIGDKDEGARSKPIDVDEVERRAQQVDSEEEEEDGQEDDGFEDVPIEGLNRLPKRTNLGEDEALSGAGSRAMLEQRQAMSNLRRGKAQTPARARRQPQHAEDPNSLFVGGGDVSDREEPTSGTGDTGDDDDELQRAIALSLQPNAAGVSSPESEEFEEVFQQTKADDSKPNFAAQKGKFANLANKRALKATPASLPVNESVEEEDDSMDLQAALIESRQSKYVAQAVHRKAETAGREQNSSTWRSNSPPKDKPPKPFSGPLPFESLDLGSSLLGKKAKKLAEDNAGGFETPGLSGGKKQAEPLPPWFSGDLKKGIDAQKAIEDEDRQKMRVYAKDDAFDFQIPPTLRTQQTGEVVDLDELEAKAPRIDIERRNDHPKVIDLESEDERPSAAIATQARDVVVEDNEIRMGDLADMVRAEPPQGIPRSSPARVEADAASVSTSTPRHQRVTAAKTASSMFQESSDEEEAYEWEASDHEASAALQEKDKAEPIGGRLQPAQDTSPSPEFENVDMRASDSARPSADSIQSPADTESRDVEGLVPMSGLADQYLPADDPSLDQALDENGYSDPEDDELLHALAAEAEEHARFASTLNHRTQAQNAADYERELKALRSQQKADRRDADEVTQIMVQECQQLLKLFGLPFVTAPMEAEAQCAELVHLGLVDGIVTDDSDVFLFGGTRVYKNLFNSAKFVECYLSADLVRDYSLDRASLVACAHLLGSDYTDGLPGVGPVTALEILAEFPAAASAPANVSNGPTAAADAANAGLIAFAAWWASVQNMSRPAAEDAASGFRKKFRKSHAARIFLPANFPDPRVTAAYLAPEVDSDPSAFAWGVPDVAALRAFLSATIGWSEERTDEVLVPVVRDINRRGEEGTQSNITRFLGSGSTVGAGPRQQPVGQGPGQGQDAEREAAAPRRRGDGGSRRMESALEKLAEGARKRKSAGAEAAERQGQDGSAVGSGEKVVERPPKAKRARPTRGKKQGGITVDEEAAEDGAEEDLEQSPMMKRVKAKAASKSAVESRRGRTRRLAKSNGVVDVDVDATGESE